MSENERTVGPAIGDDIVVSPQDAERLGVRSGLYIITGLELTSAGETFTAVARGLLRQKISGSLRLEWDQVQYAWKLLP